jgi:hypothetical protein
VLKKKRSNLVATSDNEASPRSPLVSPLVYSPLSHFIGAAPPRAHPRPLGHFPAVEPLRRSSTSATKNLLVFAQIIVNGQ